VVVVGAFREEVRVYGSSGRDVLVV
jgi:hypothetical protein